MRSHERPVLPGEIALLLGLVINSLAVTLLVKSGFGISVVSSVPYILYLAVPALSLGTWNALIQCAWMLLLSLYLGRFRPGYILSFGLAAVFGYMLDLWTLALSPLPLALPFRLLWFVLGLFSMATGIAFLVRCGLPVLPFDTVTRELVAVKGWSVRAARTRFDLTNLVLGLALSLGLLGRIDGIGVGSVVCALLLGTVAGAVTDRLDRSLTIRPRVAFFGRLA